MSKAYTAHLRILLETAIYRETRLTAGTNDLVSKKEETKAPNYIRESSKVLRQEGGPGSRLNVYALNLHLSNRVTALLDSVNQKTGVGRAHISKAERDEAVQDPSFGPLVAKTWLIAAGQRADVDTIAEIRAQESMEPDGRFMTFGTEAAAANFQDPKGRDVRWLVKVGENESKASYVRGNNDLWVERFDVDLKTGQVTTTAEH